MKKILLALIITSAVTTAANAQEAAASAPATMAPAKPQLSKEEREKQKQKMEADLAAAFKEAGLTENEIKLSKEAMEAGRQKRNELKKNTSITEEEKAKKAQEYKDEEKTKLTEIMGSKYKAFKEAQKKQKAAAPAPAN